MRPKSRSGFRIAIICGLALEAEAVEALFDETYDKFGKLYGKRWGDANTYINGRIGRHDVVLCYMPGMGKGSAASVASSLRVSYTEIQLALVVGICGGAPYPSSDREIFLGDVVVSNALVEYDFGRQYPNGFKRKSDTLRRPDREIRTLLTALSTGRTRAELQEEMLYHLHNIQQQGARWQIPGSVDILFEAAYQHKHYEPSVKCCCFDSDLSDVICEEAYETSCNSLGCDENRISRRRDKTGKPSIHIGKVAAADMVMKSGKHRDEIISKEKVIGFEMEGAGVWDNVSCVIIIKGVCDYADSHKNKIWQAYAAATGASTAKAFLEYWRPVDREEYLVESVSQPGITKLPTLEGSSNISTGLQVSHTEISSLNIPLQGIQNTLSGFETRFLTLETLVSQLVHQPVTNGSQKEINSAVITGRLLGKPGVLKEICDATKFREPASCGMTPAMNQPFGDTISKNTNGGFSCMCHSLRRLQRKIIARGWLAISFETVTERHLPGCPANQKIIDADQYRSFGLTYTGLRRLLNLAVQVSFSVTSGAGGGSLSPRFTYFPTVNSREAPAWRMLDLLVNPWLSVHSRQKLVPMVVSSIITLFRAKKASPRAVDEENRSLVHLLAECTIVIGECRPHSVSQASLHELLDYLLVNKAPANDYDLSGNTSLGRLFTLRSPIKVTEPGFLSVVEAILQSNTEGNVARLLEPLDEPLEQPRMIISGRGKHIYKADSAIIQDFLSSSARIAEVYGCGPLCKAILSNNPDQVEYLVRNYPATLAERDLFGHTPLHLAADKPSCLRIVVSAVDTRLLNETDRPGRFGEYAVETALYLSGLQRRYIHHMKDRRERLKQLARDQLSSTEVEQLGLDSDRVLDSLAPRVIHLLRERGVCIPEALTVIRPAWLPVYQALSSPQDAELFFRAGFHDTDLWYNYADVAEFARFPCEMRQELSYLHWLAKHGAVSCQLKSFESAMDIFVANYVYWKVGERLKLSIFIESGDDFQLSPKFSPFAPTCIAWVNELNAIALPAMLADGCDCKCSSEGCNPITYLLKGMLGSYEHIFSAEPRAGQSAIANDIPLPSILQHFILFLEYFGSDLEARHHTAALRYLTYTALEIPHSCCDPYFERSDECYQDVEDFEIEHPYEMKLLEELLGDFERQIITIYRDPCHGVSDFVGFWKYTWTRRMREVLNGLEGDSLGYEERRMAEEIGVIWEESTPEPPIGAGNPYVLCDLNHWIYELEKIKEECQ